MLKRFLALLGKDGRLIVRNHYLTVTVLVALVYVGSVNFLIPAEVSPEVELVLWDQTESQTLRRFYEAAVESGQADAAIIFVDSAEAYAEAMAVYGNRLGLRAEGATEGAPEGAGNGAAGLLPERLVVTYQGHENPEVRRLLEASLHRQLAALSGEIGPEFATEVLQPGTAAEKPPFNLSLLPILIYTEPGMIGVLLAAALLYAEKGEGTLRAYRVSPGSVVEYLAAKSVAMGFLGVFSATLITLGTIGLGANWPAIIGVVFLTAVVVTLITLVVANLFQTISQFLFSGIILNLALALPTVSYFLPSFSPVWLRWFPSYPMLHALREAYFPTGSEAVLTNALGQMGLMLVIALPLAVVTFRRQLIARDA